MAGSSITSNGSSPKITFWTNHGCPWAQRVQIVLKELGLPYEEVLIDLDKPREPWYLKINPVSLVTVLYELYMLLPHSLFPLHHLVWKKDHEYTYIYSQVLPPKHPHSHTHKHIIHQLTPFPPMV